MGYARTHELEVGRAETSGGFWATVTGVHAAGALVRLELADADDRLVVVDLSREQRELAGFSAGMFRLLPVAAIVSENRSGPKMLENFSNTL